MMSSFHTKFDPDVWTAKYDLETHLANLPEPNEDDFLKFDPYLRSFIDGPKSLALDLQMRSALWPNIDSDPGLMTDVFVWAWGEPHNPASTKIGGVPLFPESLQWPQESTGKPFCFVAQFNFSDSKDLVPDLPGDVLLIFCPESSSKHPRTGKKRTHLTIEESVFLFADSQSKKLHAKDQMPETDMELWPLHGHIYRSSDHPELYAKYVEPHQSVVGGMYCDPPAILRGTKIGGEPTWEQEEPSWMRKKSIWMRKKSKRRFLCQLLSDRAEVKEPDPYIGHEEKFDNARDTRQHRLEIFDLGFLYLFWDGKKIHPEIQGS